MLNYKANVNLITKPGNLKAVASISINDEFVIRNIRVSDVGKGLFVSMPSYKIGDEYKDTCFPLTAESRENMNNAVLEAYKQKLTQAKEQINEKEKMQGKNSKFGKSNKREEQSHEDQLSNNKHKTESNDAQLSEEGQDEKIEGPVMTMWGVKYAG